MTDQNGGDEPELAPEPLPAPPSSPARDDPVSARTVFRWAVAILCDTIQDVLKASSLSPDKVHLYIPHQANIRIINAAIDVLRIPRSRVFNNLDRYGNSSAGSVPLALDEAVAEGRVQPGQLIILSGFGAGLAWGTALMRW